MNRILELPTLNGFDFMMTSTLTFLAPPPFVFVGVDCMLDAPLLDLLPNGLVGDSMLSNMLSCVCDKLMFDRLVGVDGGVI